MRFVKLLVAVALITGSLAARADSLTENFTVNGTSARNNSGDYGITSSLVDRFNTSLGTLDSITVDLSGEVTLSGVPDDGTATFDFVAAGTDVNLVMVFGNGSGFGDGPFSISANASDSYSGELSMFEGEGTQDLVLNFDLDRGTVTTNGTIDGTLTYNYTPAVAPTVTSEPGGLLLLGTGLMGLAGLSWKRFAA